MFPKKPSYQPPWRVEDTNACFIVRDANGYVLAYVYFEVPVSVAVKLEFPSAVRRHTKKKASEVCAGA